MDVNVSSDMINTIPPPQVNGCYIAPGGDMLKVLVLNYRDSELESVVVETIWREVRNYSLEQWQNQHFLPCCFLGDSDLYEKNLERQGVMTAP